MATPSLKKNCHFLFLSWPIINSSTHKVVLVASWLPAVFSKKDSSACSFAWSRSSQLTINSSSKFVGNLTSSRFFSNSKKIQKSSVYETTSASRFHRNPQTGVLEDQT